MCQINCLCATRELWVVKLNWLTAVGRWLFINNKLKWELSSHSVRRPATPRRSSRTVPYPTGSDTEPTTKSGTTPPAETGDAQSWTSERRLVSSSCLLLSRASTPFCGRFALRPPHEVPHYLPSSRPLCRKPYGTRGTKLAEPYAVMSTVLLTILSQ